MRSIMPTMPAIVRADKADYLDAARNGQSGARERVRNPVRLPPDTWERIAALAGVLKEVFPDRYITVNSTVEFLLEEGFNSILTEKKQKPSPITHDTEEVDFFSE